MADLREYRLKIDGYSPDTMPMKSLVEYLADIATLFGQESSVHLVKIEASSVSPVVLVDWDAEVKVLDRVNTAKRGEGPEEPIRAIENINARLRSDNTSALLLNPNKKNVIEFPGIKFQPVKPVEWPSINQSATLFGVPIAVGGKNDPVPVHLQDGLTELHLHADRAKAKAIAQFLFSTVIKVIGRGRWRKSSGESWILERFTIDEFEPVKLANMDEALAQLRGIDSAWKRSEDPLSELDAIRNGEPSNHDGRVR